MHSAKSIFGAGLWRNNPGLVQLLGLCPLLAVTSTLVNGLGLGLATLLTLLVSNALVSASRGWLRPEIRIPVFVLIIASTVTAIELIMNAWFYGLYKVLGIFVPLIVTNCTIVARAEMFASRQPLAWAILDGLAMGIGFTLVLVVLGAVRELLGQGTLFVGAALLFGTTAQHWTISFSNDYPGFLLALLPPGAFFAFALLVAARNWLDNAFTERRTAPVADAGP
ncbi:MAG: electron transport complex subunit E [Gammaproteobacteria bacterium]|nr:electron transport complex subunit E [Gammaproteobacteria bacterium]